MGGLTTLEQLVYDAVQCDSRYTLSAHEVCYSSMWQQMTLPAWVQQACGCLLSLGQAAGQNKPHIKLSAE